MTPYIMTRTPHDAVTAIVTAQGNIELRIPKNVKLLSFIAQVRALLLKRGLSVGLHDAKRNNWKGILVTK